MKIGFIGLGNMGGPMAANLAKAGHEVTGFDMADVAIEGVTMAGSGAEAAKGAAVVITMLPNGNILRAVADEVIPAMDAGAVLLDCSTVDVDSARAVASQAQDAGPLGPRRACLGRHRRRNRRHTYLHGGWRRRRVQHRQGTL